RHDPPELSLEGHPRPGDPPTRATPLESVRDGWAPLSRNRPNRRPVPVDRSLCRPRATPRLRLVLRHPPIPRRVFHVPVCPTLWSWALRFDRRRPRLCLLVFLDCQLYLADGPRGCHLASARLVERGRARQRGRETRLRSIV